MVSNSIEVKNLSKCFGNFRAVDDVTFSVAEGEIFGLLGANGAGKSTIIRMLCGLLRPTAGTGRVAGFDIIREAERVRERIGYMSQKFSLYDDLTVEENLRFYGGMYGLSRGELSAKVRWALELTDLLGKEKKLTLDLPTGWKQRLALGCALLHEPRVVFLDEPTGGVDPEMRRHFWELIRGLSDRGVTVLVTTHYLEEAEYCHRILFLHAGHPVVSGSPLELKSTVLEHPVLEVECDRTEAALALLQSQEWVGGANVFGFRLHVQVVDEGEGKKKIIRLLEEGGIHLKRLERVSPRLEDVFLRLIEIAEAPGEGNPALSRGV